MVAAIQPQRANPVAIAAALRAAYGQPRHHNLRDPLAELVFIILSTQTREAEYRRTYRALRARWRTWDKVRRARPSAVADVIRFGGFAERKARLIKAMLAAIRERLGATTLAPLRRMRDADALRLLEALPGVGPKTARCVLMYSLGRDVLPVDTHVWRMAKRLGWILGCKHPTARRSAALEAAVPPALRYSLHVTMVAHGRAVCRAVPRCGGCILATLCPSAR